MQLILATRNAHKTREFRALLGKEFEVIDLSAFPELTLPEESGATFEQNAALKAAAAAQSQPGAGRRLLVIADDSGLEVGSLGGAPGIYSARYAGKSATDKENIDKLLGELETRNVPPDQRTARFRCVIALARDGRLLETFQGVVEGTIVNPPRGSGGFGYDPVFQPNGFDKTFAELPAETKNQISHRAIAAGKLRDFLRANRPSVARP